MTYLDIDGHPTWVEDRGSGDTVMLLHGGLSDSDLLLDTLAPVLGSFRVVAFDRRGHGRTADRPGPFSYDEMAADAVAVLRAVEAPGPTHLVGYSDGAIVALLVAQARPDLVRSVVLIGANFHHRGLLPEIALVREDDPMTGVVRDAYGERSPDGVDHFTEVLAKTLQLWAGQPTLETEDLAGIDVPALVLVGDDDAMTLSHTCALYESLPQGQLAVVPGASHLVVLEKPGPVGDLVTAFLSDPSPPGTFMPMRRHPAGGVSPPMTGDGGPA